MWHTPFEAVRNADGTFRRIDWPADPMDTNCLMFDSHDAPVLCANNLTRCPLLKVRSVSPDFLDTATIGDKAQEMTGDYVLIYRHFKR